jgi:hypothetical protein
MTYHSVEQKTADSRERQALNYAHPTLTLRDGSEWAGSKLVFLLDQQTGNIQRVGGYSRVEDSGESDGGLFVQIETDYDINLYDPTLHTVDVTMNFRYSFTGQAGVEIGGVDALAFPWGQRDAVETTTTLNARKGSQ